MLRSESNLLSRTHWWKVQSSMAIDCFPLQAGHKATSDGERQESRIQLLPLQGPRTRVKFAL